MRPLRHSLYQALTDIQLKRLKEIQNTRVVILTHNHSRITLALKYVQW